MSDRARAQGQVLAPGTARAPALVLDEPLSLWGGVDPATGRIIEPRHPQHGATVTDRALVMPAARGSSSSASVLAEMVRAGTAPAAVLLGEPDLILALGAVVAGELYGARLPIIVLADGIRSRIIPGTTVTLGEDGSVEIG
jgi:predicted aconitase with swiveling domain